MVNTLLYHYQDNGDSRYHYHDNILIRDNRLIIIIAQHYVPYYLPCILYMNTLLCQLYCVKLQCLTI